MKKIIALLLITLMSVAFCACGGDSSDSQNAESDANAAQSSQDGSDQENSNKTIDFDNVLIAEDDNIKIELIKFYEEDFTNHEVPTKNFSVRIYNKSDSNVFVDPFFNSYVGDEQVTVSMWNGNTGPAPGKNGIYSYNVYYPSEPEETDLDSLEDLYKLESGFEIEFEDENEDRFGEYEIPFTFKDVK